MTDWDAQDVVRQLRLLQNALAKINEQLEAICHKYLTENHATKAEPIKIIISEISDLALPVAIREHYESQCREAPRKNRRRRLKWLLDIAGISVLTWYACTTSRTLDEIKRQSNSAQSQVSIMQKQLEAADRPWISVDVMPAELTYTNSGVNLGIVYTFKNVGRSPAINVWKSARLVASILLMSAQEGKPTPKTTQEQLCKSAGAERMLNIPGYVLFPGDVFHDQDSLTLSMGDIRALYYGRWDKMPMPRPIPLGIVGCADYTFEASPRHHQTGFGFVVVGDKSGKSPLVTEPPMHQPVLFWRTPVGGFYFAN